MKRAAGTIGRWSIGRESWFVWSRVGSGDHGLLIGDGAYACIALGHHCNGLGVTLISRLRLDANLYEAPPVVPGRKGRKPGMPAFPGGTSR